MATTSRLESIQCADQAMLQRVLRFDDDFLFRATGMPDAEVVERFHHCAGAFHCVVNAAATTGTDRVLHGYFILLPLSAVGVDRIRNGEITSGRHISTADLSCSSPPAALYLSVVCALSAYARAAAIGACLEHVRRLYHTTAVRHLFARAATDAGARMLERLTGERFAADGVIHDIDLSIHTAITAPLTPAREG